ncbi:hypothetical protein [Neisseria weixii]|nr:hypothetical protein [Neisseria weixii]
MKQNNQDIDLTKVDLTQLDSESMDRLIDAFKGTKYYKRQNKVASIAKFIVFGAWGCVIAYFVISIVAALLK